MKLVRHPDTPELSVDSIEVAISRDGDRWRFRFAVQNADALVTPEPTMTGRAEGLWRTTCFEAFIGDRDEAYVEFNFSPSGQFAAYRFDAPRKKMRDEAATIETWTEEGNGCFKLEAAVRCDGLFPGAPVGLSAVIEEDGMRKSYWALAHPDGPPDFHDPSCFIARLPG